jgi:type I restriction enzyme S subunit
LITLTGTRKKRDYGFVSIVGDEKKLLLNQRVARLKFTKEVRAEYYLIALQSEEFRDRLFSGETGNVGQGNIGMGSITKEAVPLPPINEQDYIVSECQRLFSIIDESEKIIESELKRSKSLRQSILKKAFEGELVPQDPSDEPASILLERIKAEKSKQMEIF